MENKNNIDWNVNLNYITKDDLKTIYGFIPDADQTTTDNTKTDFTIMAIAISSERINTITGNLIEQTGFNNLNDTQKQLVKRATARMTIYYLTDGMAFIRSSVSISGNGLSSSISPPSEPDYVLMEVYNLLQQANLHTPRKAINNSISCNTDNFNTPNIFDESDRRVITWDSGNKTFLQKMSLIEGTGIKIDDVSDTIPKLKIHADSNIDSLWEVDKENSNFIKPKDFKGIDVNGKRIIDVGTPTFLSDATTKVYVDNLLDKKQDKLTAGENIKIENNVISANGGSGDSLWNNSSKDVNLKLAKNINLQGYNITKIADPIDKDDGTNKKYVDDKIKNFNLTIDKLEPLFDNNVFDIQENKFVVKANFITNILKSAYIKELETTNKGIVDAINELHKRVWKLEGDFVKIQKELIDDEKKIINNGNWKEVGIISGKNQFITYDFKPNKEYRLSFTWLPHDINNSVIQFLNFYILKEKTPFSVLQTFYQEKNADLKLCISNNLIAVLNYNNEKIDNCLYKLEELQE
ncbi:hypothetical protein [Spiroplasma endosymbiont of Panzeria rudis]|uniref:hypothetical protein n=1 Tax=Spiroplasma endosymbiont of Panzeria rudis TaxID=3066301 RepID=UPI0030D5AA48